MITDLTFSVFPGMSVFPGDPAVEFRIESSLDASDYQITRFSMGSHAGTHVDAPAHFFTDGTGVDGLDPKALIGPARVADLRHLGHPGKEVLADDIRPYLPCRRLLLATGWDKQFGNSIYYQNQPGLSEAAVDALLDAGVQLLGVDWPNLHGINWFSLHRRLLERKVVVVEALANVTCLAGQDVWLLVAPLKLKGVDGAPARVFAVSDLESITGSR